MLIIEDKLISDDVLSEKFFCDIQACKGACCVEGDYGAPLSEEELKTMKKIYPLVKPYLTQESVREINKQGLYVFIESENEFATPCINGGACAYMVTSPDGINSCGIELAHKAGAIDFKKPISCELYPIRVEQDSENNFEALNYDQWSICSAACKKGEEQKTPIFKFVKNAIIRKWGHGFYDQLEAAYEQYFK